MMIRVVAICALISLLLSSSPSDLRAQALDWLADQADVAFRRDVGSARLDAMGGIRIAIRDEGYELNLNDYGRNLSGTLWDSDGRRSDFWFRSTARNRDVYNSSGERNRTRDEQFEAGGQLTWRKNGRRILGLDYALAQLDHQVERDDDSKISGPIWGVFIGQVLGKMTLSGGLHLTSDNQDLNTEDVFAIRHHSSGIRYQGALAYRAGNVALGVQGEAQVNTIEGISRDESRFHEDELTWTRPVEIYSAAALWKPLKWVSGGLRGRSIRIDGREEASISWSDRMPDNPGRENFRTEVGTFDEEVRGFDVGSRWELNPLGGWIVAAEGEVGRNETTIIEGANYKGSRRSQESTERFMQATLGTSSPLFEERLRVGFEGSLAEIENETTIREAVYKTTGRVIAFRTGVEWFANDEIALRGGYLRIVRDEDVDLPRTLGLGSGVTLGCGYLPRGGLIQLDAAVRFDAIDPDYDGDPHVEQSRFSFSLGARFLL